MPSTAQAIAARLRNRRIELGISVFDYAKALGVTFQTVYRWESGAHIPHADRQIEVADLLKAPWAELFNPAEDDGDTVDEVA